MSLALARLWQRTETMMSEAGSENHGTCVSFYSQFIHPPLQKLKINNEINKKPTADITAPQKMSDLLTENMSACESDVLLIWKERGFSPIELGFTRVGGGIRFFFLFILSFVESRLKNDCTTHMKFILLHLKCIKYNIKKVIWCYFSYICFCIYNIYMHSFSRCFYPK